MRASILALLALSACHDHMAPAVCETAALEGPEHLARLGFGVEDVHPLLAGEHGLRLAAVDAPDAGRDVTVTFGAPGAPWVEETTGTVDELPADGCSQARLGRVLAYEVPVRVTTGDGWLEAEGTAVVRAAAATPDEVWVTTILPVEGEALRAEAEAHLAGSVDCRRFEADVSLFAHPWTELPRGGVSALACNAQSTLYDWTTPPE